MSNATILHSGIIILLLILAMMLHLKNLETFDIQAMDAFGLIKLTHMNGMHLEHKKATHNVLTIWD